MCSLTQKYNVSGPRYTSYPTVPYWESNSFSGVQWNKTVNRSFIESNEGDGISLYIHLPFCESMCTFCGCHKRITKRHEVEIPYIKAVLKEWQLYCNLLDNKPRIKELHLGGGTPTFFAPENLKMLINGIFSMATKAKGYEFSFEGHPNNTTYEHLEALYELGFRRVCFGVQDYNRKVQLAINRIQSFKAVKQVTEWARAIGYTSVGHDIIYGLPFQTIEDVQNTITKTQEIGPDRLAFYSYAHVPWLKGNGQRGYLDKDLPTALEKSEQYKKGKALLKQVGYKEIGMDHFALVEDSLFKAMTVGKLHRNFMGYTASSTKLLIGLGVSSISDSWYGFAQNVKSVEEYQHLVENNIIPIYRGHILSDEDQIIRKHILNLMCNYTTSWKDAMRFSNLDDVLERLAPLQDDGLVIVENNTLKVTEAGKAFIRNICMAFDVRLHAKKREEQLFSMTV